MTRKVEEIFNVVANSRHYHSNLYLFESFSYFMCDALDFAEDSGLILKEEEYLATKAIAKYLREFSKYNKIQYIEGFAALEDALKYAGLPSTFEDRKAIYLDWANRPKPWKRN